MEEPAKAIYLIDARHHADLIDIIKHLDMEGVSPPYLSMSKADHMQKNVDDVPSLM